MNTYFETAVTSPDEKMIKAERDDLLLQIENMHKEIDRLNGELSHMRSDNEALKDSRKNIIEMLELIEKQQKGKENG